MTDFLATGDCGDQVTLTQTKASSFPVNVYTAGQPAEEFASGDTVTLPHGTPTIAIHAEYRAVAGGPVLATQDFIRPVTWATNCNVTTTTRPTTTTTTAPLATTTTRPSSPGETTTTVLVPSTAPHGTLPATGTGTDLLAGTGITLALVGILAVIGGAIRRVHH